MTITSTAAEDVSDEVKSIPMKPAKTPNGGMPMAASAKSVNRTANCGIVLLSPLMVRGSTSSPNRVRTTCQERKSPLVASATAPRKTAVWGMVVCEVATNHQRIEKNERLLHAGIINAGGFLINRLAPLYGLSPAALHVAFAVGALTAVVGATMMLAQNDIKKTLGFSTIGQMGYMIMECGLGAYALAVFHLIAHGFFKGTVFLYCGNVIHKARQGHGGHSPHHPQGKEEFSLLTWLTGLIATLVIPLLILLAIHDILSIPLLESHGTVIFLFFIWITSSQAILTLTRLRVIESWKVAVIMLWTLIFIVFVYLFAAESFTAFLYPNPAEVEFYLRAAALPEWLFSTIIVVITLLIVMSWSYLYMRAHGKSVRMPDWMEGLRIRLYVRFMNRIYADRIYEALGRVVTRSLQRIVKRDAGWWSK